MKTSLNIDVDTGDPCPICLDQGFVVRDLPVNHPDFGRALPCECQAEKIALHRQARLSRVGNLSHLQHMTFDTFLPNREDLPENEQQILQRAHGIARRFAENPIGWLVLIGDFGCGKTHLAASIAHAVLQQGQPAVFIVVPDLLDHLRAAFSPTAETTFDERFEQVKQAPLLILDDFGSQSATPWAKEKLFQILNYRYVAHLPTIITTNLTLPELEPRIRSRIADAAITQIMHINVPDYRTIAYPMAHESSILALHGDKTFENFDLRSPELKGDAAKSLATAKKLAQAFASIPRGWLVFGGMTGCGKTHLAAAIANWRTNVHRERAMFLLVPDLLDYLRAAFNPTSHAPLDVRFDEIKRAPLLILDDLGMESATPWAREKLFQLLDYRYSARLPTIFTTSIAVAPDDSSRGSRKLYKTDERTITDVHPWLANRMLDKDRCQIVTILAPSYRDVNRQGLPGKKEDSEWIRQYEKDERFGSS